MSLHQLNLRLQLSSFAHWPTAAYFLSVRCIDAFLGRVLHDRMLATEYMLVRAGDSHLQGSWSLSASQVIDVVDWSVRVVLQGHGSAVHEVGCWREQVLVSPHR
eukprot:4809277-Pleurochrysis_carterae.AAC.1